jgi:adenylate cyclase
MQGSSQAGAGAHRILPLGSTPAHLHESRHVGSAGPPSWGSAKALTREDRMERITDPVVERLVNAAEMDAERTLALVRMAIAAILAAWLFTISEFVSRHGDTLGATARTTAALTLASLFLVGVVSLALAKTGRFRPWMAYLFGMLDAVTIGLAVFMTLRVGGLGGNWVFAMPGVWTVPLLLSVGALRYRPGVQVWSTLLLVSAIAGAAIAAGLGPAGPSDAGLAAQFFSVPPTVVRAFLVLVAGLVMALAMSRARSVLVRAVQETTSRANLSRFLPAEIAPLIESDRSGDWREGRRQIVAILFVDLRNSTALAEDMDPKRLSIFIASFRRRILRAAAANGGVIDKFIGDAAMILFGLPEPRSDDAKRALDCARDIQRLLDRWNAKRSFDPPVRVAMGLHRGEVYCGVIGDTGRLEFTVLGDPVNVTARIEQATKEFQVSILASEELITAAGEAPLWRSIGTVPLRGRKGRVTLLAPIPELSAAGPAAST